MLVLVRAAAAACQPYSSVKQLVSCAPAALIKLRVPPHMGGFLGYVLQNQGEKHSLCQWNVEVRGRDVICKSMVEDMVQVGTIPLSQKNL